MTFLLWIALIAILLMIILWALAVIGEADVEELVTWMPLMHVVGVVALLAILGQVVLTVTVGILQAVAA